MEAAQLASVAAQAAQSKKAKDVVLLDMRGISSVTDYFVICHGSSAIQIRAIADHILEQMEALGAPRHHVEGYQNARWILLDFGDVVVHVFHENERGFYSLERLWGDAAAVHV